MDSSGNVFVTGYSTGSASDADYATIAYSNVGLPMWINRYNGPGNYADLARAITVDKNGNVFVTGYSTGSGGNYDYATIAYSNAGAPLWTNRYNGPGNTDDYAYGIAVDSSGNVFVTGTSYASSVDRNADYATIKYSGAGVPLWTNRYNGPANSDDLASAVAVDSSGNVFVIGRSYNGTSFDFAMIKYSGAGVPLWTNRYNGPGNGDDSATAIAVDSSGNVFVTGYSQGISSGDDYATIKYSSSIPAPPHLAFQTLNNQLVLNWTNAGFMLQSAPDLTSTFTNIPNGSSPFTNAGTAPQQFFRLKAD